MMKNTSTATTMTTTTQGIHFLAPVSRAPEIPGHFHSGTAENENG